MRHRHSERFLSFELVRPDRRSLWVFSAPVGIKELHRICLVTLSNDEPESVTAQPNTGAKDAPRVLHHNKYRAERSAAGAVLRFAASAREGEELGIHIMPDVAASYTVISEALKNIRPDATKGDH